MLLWSVMLLGAAGILVGALAGCVSACCRWGTEGTVAFSMGVVAAVLMFVDLFGWCYPCHQFLDTRNPHLVYTPVKSLGFTVGVALLASALGAGVGIAVFVIRRFWRLRCVRLGLYFALAGSLALASVLSYLATPTRGEHRLIAPPEAPVRSGGVDRLVLIVDEALTWEVIDPLIDNGRLPALESLVRTGVRGELSTGFPTLSHPLLTTVATGHNPRRHGIGSKVRYAFPGMTSGVAGFPCPYRLMLPHVFINLANLGIGRGLPMGPDTRKVKALWNILGDSGVSVGVVGWRCTWPAEQVNGFMVSRRFHKNHPQDHISPVTALDPLERAVGKLPGIAIERFVPCRKDDTIKDERVAGRLGSVRKCLEDDLRYHLAAKELDGLFNPAFLALGFLSMDCVSHNFSLEYALLHRPDEFHMSSYLAGYTSEEIVECAGGVIDSGYVFHDSLISEWMPSPEKNTAFILASDHGFEMDGSNHYYSAPGIIILNGTPFRKGASIGGATIYDIAPTVLHVLGLPVPRDMEGKVLREALDPVWLEANPIRTVTTYER